MQGEEDMRETTTTWERALCDWLQNRMSSADTSSESGVLDEATPMFERAVIETALVHTGGRRGQAAKVLGWGRNTLTRKIQELGMTEPPEEDESK